MGIFGKGGWFSSSDEEFVNEEEFEVEEDEEIDVDGVAQGQQRQRGGNVVSLSNSDRNAKVVLLDPKSFADASATIENFTLKRTTIVNLEQCDTANAQRIVDFIGGAVVALHGTVTFVSKRVLVIAPSVVEIVDDRHSSND